MRADELRDALADVARDLPAPGTATSAITRGKRRLLRRRAAAGAVVVALIGTAVGLAAASRNDARRGLVVSPTPTSASVPAFVAPSPHVGPQVVFVSASEGWVCSDPILHTADGGAHWQAQDYTAAGSRTCAAVPTDAWIFVQSPAGAVQVLPVQGGTDIAGPTDLPALPAGATVRQATFVDRKTGWMLAVPAGAEAAHGLLYRTSESGVRFALVSRAAPIGGVRFSNATDGWGIDGTSVEHTTDGGSTWSTVVVPGPGAIVDHFVGLGVRGAAVVVEGFDESGGVGRTYFLVSSDRGVTWTRRGGPPATAPPAAPSQLETMDVTTWGLMFGARLWSTSDAGRTWSPSPLPANTVSIAFPTTGSRWALDGSGALFHWSAAGSQWLRVDTKPQPNWTTLLSPIPGGPTACPKAPPLAGTSHGAGTSAPDPAVAAVAAAREFVLRTRGWTDTLVTSVYPVTRPGGTYGGLFASNIPKDCGVSVAGASYGVELANPSVTFDNSSFTALVVAPFAGGPGIEWRVWGFYR